MQILGDARRSPPVPERGPLVSVVIATYNWSSVLRYAIQTALWQTYRSIEVLVIGDACTDDSESVAASFEDPRVRWHNLAENLGQPSRPERRGSRARARRVCCVSRPRRRLASDPSRLADGSRVDETGARLAQTLTEWIGPNGYRGYDVPPVSAILHELELGREVGWRDYREIAEGPDWNFIRRARELAPMVTVPVLTVFKFPSAWRKNSYVEKPCHEQARMFIASSTSGRSSTGRSPRSGVLGSAARAGPVSTFPRQTSRLPRARASPSSERFAVSNRTRGYQPLRSSNRYGM